MKLKLLLQKTEQALDEVMDSRTLGWAILLFVIPGSSVWGSGYLLVQLIKAGYLAYINYRNERS